MSDLATGHRLRAAVGSSGRRALRDLRSLLGVAVLTLGGVAAALAVQDHPGIDRQALEAGAADLAVVSTYDAAGMIAGLQYLGQEDLLAAGSIEVGTAALSNHSESAAAWRRFSSRPVMVPGEEELRERYEALVAEAREWSAGFSDMDRLARLTDDATARAEVVTESGEHNRERLEVLDELRSSYAGQLEAAGQEQEGAVNALRHDVSIAATAGFVVLLLGFFALERAGRRRATVLEEVEALLEEEGERTRLEGQLSRALEICKDEGSAYRILEAAVDVVVDDGGAELLVADSSLAHLAQVADAGDAPSCQVRTPAECPAVRRGHTQDFPDPKALDACPELRDRGGDHFTTCVPFTVGGNSVGVLHVATRRSLPASTVTQVELVARKTGERVGVARAFAKSQDQARTDPLTGLLNRRSLEDRAREVVESGRPYAVVFADLDHFKTLNDVHGHDAGDRALRLFSRCLREGVRPADAAARYGGEEFVVVLPDCTADGASDVIARVRDALENSLNAGTVPRFTASFGITEAVGGPLGDVIARADVALLAAKRGGRNRSIVWNAALDTGPADDDVAAVTGDEPAVSASR